MYRSEPMPSNLIYQVWRIWNVIRHCIYPSYAAWILLWPIPWRLSVPHLAAPFEVRREPKKYLLAQVDDRILQTLPLYRWRDTPTRSLYRLYEIACAGPTYHTNLKEESTYFFHQESWVIADIPDPLDPDPIRYAMLACFVEALVSAFNWKIMKGVHRGYHFVPSEVWRERARTKPDWSHLKERRPKWAKAVPPVAEVVSFQDETIGAGDSKYFLKRNIRVCTPLHNL